MSNAQELARQLLGRLASETGSTTGAAGSGTSRTAATGAVAAGARQPAATRPEAAINPGAAARPPAALPSGSRKRTLLTDLPQVRESLARDKELSDGLAAASRPSPFYRCHEGVNGATIHLDGREYVNYSSYNYLGLANHPRLIAAARAALECYGTTSGATRIVSGNIPLHEELEQVIADAYDVDDATTVGSGYLTNAAVIGFVLGEKDLAVCDALVHNSIVTGTRWAGCQRLQFRHNDPESLDTLLVRTRSHFERVMVILEGVYSMDGDYVALPEMIEVARRHDAFVMVDEAHSFGVLGECGGGVRELFGLPGDAVDIWMGTLSKALAGHGGFIAGNWDFIQACRMSAPGMSLYAAGLTPATAAANAEAIRVIADEPERLVRLRANSERFLGGAKAAGLDVGPAHGTPIIPVMIGSTLNAVQAAVQLADQGVNANPIAFPAVAEHEARLRFFLSSEHTREMIDRTLQLLAGILAGLGARASLP
jgi:8-amino-7-oxononanoate synthase